MRASRRSRIATTFASSTPRRRCPPQRERLERRRSSSSCRLIPASTAPSASGKLQETVEQVKRHLQSRAGDRGLSDRKVPRHKAHADFERQLRELYGPLVLQDDDTGLRYGVVACSNHLTVGEYVPASPAAVALERLVKELTYGQATGRKIRNARPQQWQAKQTASRLTTRPTVRRTARAGGHYAPLSPRPKDAEPLGKDT